MVSSQRKAAGTRQQILAAAERLFARYIFSKVTMQEVAAEAGLQKASLYYYFPTKEELFQAVIDRKYIEFRSRVEQILSSDAPAGDRLEAYSEARFAHFLQMLNLNLMEFKIVSQNRPVLNAMFRRNARRELRWLCQLFDEGMRRKEFVARPKRQIAEAFLHIHQGLRARVMRAIQQEELAPAAFSRLHREQMLVTRIFLDGLRNGSPAPTKMQCSTEAGKEIA